MANKLAISSGNFLTGTNWVSSNTGGVLVSTSASLSALTVANLDSAAFVLAATAVQYVAIRPGLRGAGAATNKMTVILRNTTTATDIFTFVINVSDIDACVGSADDNDGWYAFFAAASHLPNGVDSYIIRCKLDAVTTAVSLSTNGTAANWQHQIFGTTTSVPVAGDDMLVTGIWDSTNPAIKTNVSINMNETVNTNYGSGLTNARTAALTIGKGGTVTFDRTISSLLQLAGFCSVFSGGLLDQGSPASPILLGNTATLQFSPAADITMGVQVYLGGQRTGEGQPEIAGVTNVYALLTADLAVAGTAVTVDRQLSAKNGDTVGFGSTSATQAQFETAVLNADAGATSLSLSAGVAFGHTGTNGKQGTVVSLSRNVIVKSANAFAAFEIWLPGSICSLNWVMYQTCGQGTTVGALRVNNTNGAIAKTIIRDGKGIGIILNANAVGTTINDVVMYNTNTGAQVINAFSVAPTCSGVSINGVIVIGQTGSNGRGILIQNPASCTSINNLRTASCSDGIFFGEGGQDQVIYSGNNMTITNLSSCSLSSGEGLTVWGVTDLRITTVDNWNASNGNITLSGVVGNLIINDFRVQNGSVGGVVFQNCVSRNLVFQNGVIAGNNIGLAQQNGSWVTKTIFQNVLFGTTAGGFYTANVANHDVLSRNAVDNQNLYDILFDGCSFNQSIVTSFHTTGFTMNGARYSFQKANAVAGTNFTDIYNIGRIAYQTTAIVGLSPSLKLTPANANVKLDISGGYFNEEIYIPVDNGQTPTISIQVQKDGTYNGNAPRLIIKANGALGITTDIILDTLTFGANLWETLTGVAPAVTDIGILRVVVDCDGTAGNIYVTGLVVTGAGAGSIGNMTYFLAGLAKVELASSPVSSGGGSFTFTS